MVQLTGAFRTQVRRNGYNVLAAEQSVRRARKMLLGEYGVI